jgi:predicted dehydrogenase
MDLPDVTKPCAHSGFDSKKLTRANSNLLRNMKNKKCAIFGLSKRAITMFTDPILASREECNGARLVAIHDIDGERVRQYLAAKSVQIPFYGESEIEKLLSEQKPDIAIVAGPDYTHHAHLLKLLARRIPIICEKPMVIASEECVSVLQAEIEYEGKLLIAHNFRYLPLCTRIKEILDSGELGKIVQINFEYLLDTYHGASYFTRWNRERRYSGSLAVHKSCHHLDLLTWWLADAPERVFATGSLNFFGPQSPHRPDATPPEEQKLRCPYYKKWFGPEELKSPVGDSAENSATANRLSYKRQYPKPQYIYDSEIDIEDTYSSLIHYSKGASACYSVNFSAPWEGFRLSISGTHGRLETQYVASPKRYPLVTEPFDRISIMPLFAQWRNEEIPKETGGHGGADAALRRDLFHGPSDMSRKLNRLPTSRDGAIAVVLGEAIWRSAVDKTIVSVKNLQYDRDFHPKLGESS